MMNQSASMAPVNGVNVEQLGETIQHVTARPSLAAFQFRARGRWLEGSRNRVTIDGFFGAGAEHAHPAPFSIDGDEPVVLLGGDQAANPTELLLAALSACLTTTIVYHAAARGIRIESLETSLEGDVDLRGFLGLAPEVRKGYQGIRARVRIKADAPPATLAELSRMSPVLDTVSNAVPVSVEIEAA